MAKDIVLGGFFVHATDKTGVTGLTVTIDVWRVALADLAKSEVVTASSCTEIGDGVYGYRVANADLQTYLYFAILKTSDDSVAQKHVAAVMLDFADSPGIAALVWTYGTRTLTSLSALVASVAAAVWAYATRTLTMSPQEIADAVAGSSITQYRGTTWTIALTGLGDLSAHSKLWFTVKDSLDDADTDALLQVEKTDGLKYLNGAAYPVGSKTDGAIAIDDASAGNITITVKPAATAQVARASKKYWDVKMLTTGGLVSVLAEGNGAFTVRLDTTRAVS